MTGSFATMSTALSALKYSRVALDVAAGNIANAETTGYSRRRVEAETIGAPARPAMWSRYDGGEGGVRVGGLNRMVDPFLDARSRSEHGTQSHLEVRLAALERLETGIAEPGDNGVAAALAQFRLAWHDLANDPSGDAARNQVLSRARTLAQTLATQSGNVTAEASGQRVRAQGIVAEVNTLASALAAVNKSISVAHLNGADANDLLDRRDQLGMRLAELAGAQATVGPQGSLDVTVNGQPLVTGQVAQTLSIVSGIAPDGSADGAPVVLGMTDPAGTTVPLSGRLRGELGGSVELLNTTLPDYLGELNAVARTLADTVNAQHAAGYDAAGDPGQPLFSYVATDAAATLAVVITDPALVAASGQPGGVIDGGNAQLLGATNPAEGQYQRLVNGFGTEVASVRRLASNQEALTTQLDSARDQLSGVNIDEETVSMLAHQRVYEAAAKVLTTIDSMLDTLINRTGLLR